ncbi:nitroreductase family protein [Paenibacillus sp. 1P07SE]|uniref:nitroreductase family protein n=1 Tax=Paenibacillus sp. 1P07SE TaxID=3132209 RepID=UPI0039A73987
MESVTKQEAAFIDVIKGRRSVRHYDASVKIPDEELKEILTEATLAPSGANLQPWRFIVFTDPAIKQQLLPIANNQQQVVDASAVIAVLGDLESHKQAEQIYSASVEAGYMTPEVKETLVGHITAGFAGMDGHARKNGVMIDCGLVSMQLMLAAKARGYDTVAMGGYDAAQFVETFQIPERYVPVILIAVGKASQTGHPTVRLPLDDVVLWNGMAQ